MNRAIPLWPADWIPGRTPDSDAFVSSIMLYPVKAPRGAVLVLPGGGYQHKAAHEGAPIAERFNAEGVFAAVLDYRLAPYHAPVPQWDAMRAVQWLRCLAPEYGYAPDQIAILGFSAGGHLAASVTWLDIPMPEPSDGDPVSRLDPRPSAAILCYPVVTMGRYTHAGSRDNLLGENAPASLIDCWSVEQHIPHGAPPAFIWHTADDASVPVQNSLNLANALAAQEVPFSLHVWPHGRHGLGLASETADISQWPRLAAEWLRSLW